MSSRRAQKIAEAIREVVSMSILTELQDPRIRDVTVTFVEAAGDLRSAKILVSVMGDDVRQELCRRGLQNAAGFLQAKIADRLELRYTPRLTFVLDQGVKKSIEVAKILREVLPPSADEADPEATDDAEADSAASPGPPPEQASHDDNPQSQGPLKE